MQIGRLEFGKTIFHVSDNPIRRYFDFSYDKGMCGCHILNLSIFYFTWMGDECYHNPPENWEK